MSGNDEERDKSDATSEEENIYDSISDFDLGTQIINLTAANKGYEEDINNLKQCLLTFKKQITDVTRTKDNLKKLVSSLYLTARREIDRKDNMISELQRKLDNAAFRRYNRSFNTNLGKNRQDVCTEVRPHAEAAQKRKIDEVIRGHEQSHSDVKRRNTQREIYWGNGKQTTENEKHITEYPENLESAQPLKNNHSKYTEKATKDDPIPSRSSIERKNMEKNSKDELDSMRSSEERKNTEKNRGDEPASSRSSAERKNAEKTSRDELSSSRSSAEHKNGTQYHLNYLDRRIDRGRLDLRDSRRYYRNRSKERDRTSDRRYNNYRDDRRSNIRENRYNSRYSRNENRRSSLRQTILSKLNEGRKDEPKKDENNIAKPCVRAETDGPETITDTVDIAHYDPEEGEIIDNTKLCSISERDLNQSVAKGVDISDGGPEEGEIVEITDKTKCDLSQQTKERRDITFKSTSNKEELKGNKQFVKEELKSSKSSSLNGFKIPKKSVKFAEKSEELDNRKRRSELQECYYDRERKRSNENLIVKEREHGSGGKNKQRSTSENVKSKSLDLIVTKAVIEKNSETVRPFSGNLLKQPLASEIDRKMSELFMEHDPPKVHKRLTNHKLPIEEKEDSKKHRNVNKKANSVSTANEKNETVNCKSLEKSKVVSKVKHKKDVKKENASIQIANDQGCLKEAVNKEDKEMILENPINLVGDPNTADQEQSCLKSSAATQPPEMVNQFLASTSVPQSSKICDIPPTLHLTHDGEIPVLHLEDISFSNASVDGALDKNIYNLMDVMNITASNLEVDVTKFKSNSDEGEARENISNSILLKEAKDTLTFSNCLNDLTTSCVSANEQRLCTKVTSVDVSSKNYVVYKDCSDNQIPNCIIGITESISCNTSINLKVTDSVNLPLRNSLTPNKNQVVKIVSKFTPLRRKKRRPIMTVDE